MSDNTRRAVADFMRRIGAKVPDAPWQKLDPGVLALRLELVAEETVETCSALRRGDLVGAADGFADLKYVIVGTACALGLPIDDCFPEPSTLVEPRPMPEISLKLMAKVPPLAERLRKAAVNASSFDWRACAVVLAKMDAAASLVASVDLGLPLTELFDEVHASNMTKQASDRSIGFAKYPPGGKGPGYKPPAIEEILAKASLKKPAQNKI